MSLLMQDSNLKNELSKHGPFVKTADLTFSETSKSQKSFVLRFQESCRRKICAREFFTSPLSTKRNLFSSDENTGWKTSSHKL